MSQPTPLSHRPADLGRALGLIRQAAGRQQAELAETLKIEASRLSRFERGDRAARELTDAEVLAYLHAIASDEARTLQKVLLQPWKVIQAPGHDHPEALTLLRAERTLQHMGEVRDTLAPVLSSVVELQRSNLVSIASLLRSTEHDVTFIGKIAAGKSSTISMLAGLRLSQKASPPGAKLMQESVLELGSGRTTVCEVQVERGPAIGIAIEPEPEEEVRRLVADLASFAWRQRSLVADEDFQGIAVEVERYLRNMAGLARVRGADAKTTDPLAELAATCASEEALAEEIHLRIDPVARLLREIWYDPAIGMPPMKWLREEFRKLNQGRSSGFTLPRRIHVRVVDEVLPGFVTTFVDTRGIADNPERPDLRRRLDDPRSILVLSTRFPSAPDDAVVDVWERARASETPSLRDRALWLVLHHNDEALNLKRDDGETVESMEEGCAIRREQMRSDLMRLQGDDLPVVFFNAALEDPDGVNAEILRRIRALRAAWVGQVENLCESFQSLIEHQEPAAAALAGERVAGGLRRFAAEQGTLPESKKMSHHRLIYRAERVHAATLRASLRRDGHWEGLDFPYLIAEGAVEEARRRAGVVIRGLSAVLTDKRGDLELAPAVALVDEVERSIPVWVAEFLDRVRRASSILYAKMEGDVGLWSNCRAVKGRGFRGEVCRQLEAWFEDHEEDETKLQSRIEKAWRACVVDRLLKLDASLPASN